MHKLHIQYLLGIRQHTLQVTIKQCNNCGACYWTRFVSTGLIGRKGKNVCFLCTLHTMYLIIQHTFQIVCSKNTYKKKMFASFVRSNFLLYVIKKANYIIYITFRNSLKKKILLKKRVSILWGQGKFSEAKGNLVRSREI